MGVNWSRDALKIEREKIARARDQSRLDVGKVTQILERFKISNICYIYKKPRGRKVGWEESSKSRPDDIE